MNKMKLHTVKTQKQIQKDIVRSRRTMRFERSCIKPSDKVLYNSMRKSCKSGETVGHMIPLHGVVKIDGEWVHVVSGLTNVHNLEIESSKENYSKRNRTSFEELNSK